MYGNIRRSNKVNAPRIATVEDIEQAMIRAQNPIAKPQIKEADGGALRSYMLPKIHFQKHQ